MSRRRASYTRTATLCASPAVHRSLRATASTAFVVIRAISHQRLIEPEGLGAFGRSLHQFILPPYLDVRKCLHVLVFGDDDTIHGGRAGRKYPDVIIAFEAILRQDPVAALSPEVINDRPVAEGFPAGLSVRSEEHTSELQSLMRISYAV